MELGKNTTVEGIRNEERTGTQNKCKEERNETEGGNPMKRGGKAKKGEMEQDNITNDRKGTEADEVQRREGNKQHYNPKEEETVTKEEGQKKQDKKEVGERIIEKEEELLLTYKEAVMFLEKVGVSRASGGDNSINKDQLDNVNKHQLTFLNRIVTACMNNLPFQNVSILSVSREERKVPSLQEVVAAGLNLEGGVCFTINIFMCILLRTLGFKAHVLDGSYSASDTSHTHVMVLVQDVRFPGDDHIVDVGCGYPFFEAVSLANLPATYNEAGLEYRYIRQGNTLFRMHREGDDREPNEQHIMVDEWRQVFHCNLSPVNYHFFYSHMKSVYIDENSYFLQVLRVARFSNVNEMSVQVSSKCPAEPNVSELPEITIADGTETPMHDTQNTEIKVTRDLVNESQQAEERESKDPINELQGAESKANDTRGPMNESKIAEGKTATNPMKELQETAERENSDRMNDWNTTESNYTTETMNELPETVEKQNTDHGNEIQETKEDLSEPPNSDRVMVAVRNQSLLVGPMCRVTKTKLEGKVWINTIIKQFPNIPPADVHLAVQAISERLNSKKPNE